MDQVLAHLIHLNQTRPVRLVRLPVSDGKAGEADKALARPSADPETGAGSVRPVPDKAPSPAMADALRPAVAKASAEPPAAIKVTPPAKEPPATERRRSGLWPFSR